MLFFFFFNLLPVNTRTLLFGLIWRNTCAPFSGTYWNSCDGSTGMPMWSLFRVAMSGFSVGMQLGCWLLSHKQTQKNSSLQVPCYSKVGINLRINQIMRKEVVTSSRIWSCLQFGCKYVWSTCMHAHLWL